MFSSNSSFVASYLLRYGFNEKEVNIRKLEFQISKNKIREKLSELNVNQMSKLLSNINKYHPKEVIQQAALAYLVHNNSKITSPFFNPA